MKIATQGTISVTFLEEYTWRSKSKEDPVTKARSRVKLNFPVKLYLPSSLPEHNSN